MNTPKPTVIASEYDAMASGLQRVKPGCNRSTDPSYGVYDVTQSGRQVAINSIQISRARECDPKTGAAAASDICEARMRT